MRTETLHLTLAFGNIDMETAEELIDATPCTASNPAA